MTGDSKQIQGLGGARKGAVDAVIEDGAEELSVADAGTQATFLDAWTRTLTSHARHLRGKGLDLAAPVVVVYADNCADVGEPLVWIRRPMHGGSPTDPLAGTLAVGTGEIGAYLRQAPVSDSNTATDAIQAAGLGSSLTVALLSTTMLVIWPEGIDSQASPLIQRELDDAPVVFDLAALEHQLGLFYETTARQTTKWWKDAKARITVASPEGVVQSDLLTFLRGKFAEVARVKTETRIGNGRSDITLAPRGPNTISAVLELKVTRDFMTPQPGTVNPTPINLKDNIDWARSGVAQTAAYRDDDGMEVAYLCVYDFCAGNRAEISQGIKEAADPYGVLPRRYWITASHKEHREDRYPDPPPKPPDVK